MRQAEITATRTCFAPKIVTRSSAACATSSSVRCMRAPAYSRLSGSAPPELQCVGSELKCMGRSKEFFLQPSSKKQLAPPLLLPAHLLRAASAAPPARRRSCGCSSAAWPRPRGSRPEAGPARALPTCKGVAAGAHNNKIGYAAQFLSVSCPPPTFNRPWHLLALTAQPSG